MINFGSSNGLLTINLQAIADNYKLFTKQTSNGCNVASVIKANAYGLGLKQIASKLKQLHCPQFFVATFNEAIELRNHDNKTPIAVLGGLMNGIEKDYLEHNIVPVLNTPDDIQRWQRTAQQQNKKLPAIFHVDTGMNRLGLSTEETNVIINDPKTIDGLNVRIIMSHFACADEKDHPLTKQQADNFTKIAKHFPHAKKSLANSSGLYRDPAYHHDMVRPGYALYGGNPTPELNNPMNPVVSLNARILQIRECKKGKTIGYGASHTFEKDTRTATIALGYADGFFRAHSGKAITYYKGQPCPILGRVSMDLVTIDISNIKGETPKQNDYVEILGSNQNIDDLAETAGTIGYEILTSLGHRYKREYI